MTSSNGNIFRVTGHLCGEFTGPRWHKGQWRGALMFSVICARINGWVNNGEAGDWDAIAPIMTLLYFWRDTFHVLLNYRAMYDYVSKEFGNWKTYIEIYSELSVTLWRHMVA